MPYVLAWRRGQRNPPQTLQARLRRATEELRYADLFDATVINDDLERANPGSHQPGTLLSVLMSDSPVLSPLQDKRLLLGVCGSIAAYKAAELIRLLRGAGSDVQVLATPDAAQFISPLTLGDSLRSTRFGRSLSEGCRAILDGAYYTRSLGRPVCDCSCYGPNIG